MWALCSWSSRSAVVVAGGDVRAHRHGVDQQAHHRFRAGHLGRPPRDRGAEDDIMLAGQPHQQLRPGALQHGVDGGVARPRQLARAPAWSRSDTRNEVNASQRPAPSRAGGPTSVGVSKPASTSRQAARAASRSRSASQVTNRRYGRRRGQPLPVVAGEDLLQQDRQRPAIQHDVVIGQHKPVPVSAVRIRRRSEGRRVGEVADRGAFGGAHPLDLLLDVDAVGVEIDEPPAATGSAGMICTGSSNCPQKRAARWGWRVTTVCTASRSRCGSSGPVTVMSSCTAYTSSSCRARCWRGRAVPAAAGSAAGCRRSGIAAAARRSAVGSAGRVRYRTGSARRRRARTCAQMPARASNHSWLSRLICA